MSLQKYFTNFDKKARQKRTVVWEDFADALWEKVRLQKPESNGVS
jgi:transposase